MAQTKTSTTTKKTTTRRKPAAKPAPKKTTPVKLDTNCFQFEILELYQSKEVMQRRLRF